MDDFVELKPGAAVKLEWDLRDQSSFSVYDPNVPISGPQSGLDEAPFSANSQYGSTFKKTLSLGYNIAAGIFNFLRKLAIVSSNPSQSSVVQDPSDQFEGQSTSAAATTSLDSSQTSTSVNNISARQEGYDQAAPANTHAHSAYPTLSPQQEPRWLLMCSRPHKLPTSLSHLNTCSGRPTIRMVTILTFAIHPSHPRVLTIQSARQDGQDG